MKIKHLILAGFIVFFAMPVLAQNNASNDSIARAVKVKELTIKKENLIKQIKIEDAKRDMSISGVTFETQEILNDRQDSICLDLRSQLVSIELEIKELKPLADVETAISRHLEKLNKDAKSEKE